MALAPPRTMRVGVTRRYVSGIGFGVLAAVVIRDAPIHRVQSAAEMPWDGLGNAASYTSDDWRPAQYDRPNRSRRDSNQPPALARRLTFRGVVSSYL